MVIVEVYLAVYSMYGKFDIVDIDYYSDFSETPIFIQNFCL